MPQEVRTCALCLICLIVSLLLVGIVSSTLPIHLIQVVPAAVVLAAIAGRSKWATQAALPIFLSWIAIMILIWLWLLGLARIVTGHFTPAEIMLTLVIGACSIRGAVAAARASSGGNLMSRIGMFVLFAGLQMGAMRLSYA